MGAGSHTVGKKRRFQPWQVGFLISTGVVVGLILLAFVSEQIMRYRDPDGYARMVAQAKADLAATNKQREIERKATEERNAAEEAAAARKKGEAKAIVEAEVRDQEAELAAVKRSGAGCLSWDGSNPSTVREVKDLLREPDSFEHIKTKIYPSINGQHGLWMRYRARNGFGGMAVEMVEARIDAATCQATLRSLPATVE